MNRRSVLRAVAGTAAVGASGCLDSTGGEPTRSSTDESTDVSGTVHIAGSSTVYPLTLRVAEQFGNAHPAASVSLSSTGTGGGFTDFFCRGKTDVNGASRPITTPERDECRENDVSFHSFQVATDALTVIVNDDADWVDCVTPEELAAIWEGNGAERWSDVRPAWPDEPIEHYGPTSESGTFDYFADEVLGGVSAHRRDYDGTEQDSTIVERVRESEYAVGYLGFAYYTQNSDAVTALAVDDGDGCVAPSLSTAKSGAYEPLSRPLFVYVARSSLRDPAVRSFVRYYLDRVDTDLVSDVGYVPLDEETAAENREKLDDALAERG